MCDDTILARDLDFGDVAIVTEGVFCEEAQGDKAAGTIVTKTECGIMALGKWIRVDDRKHPIYLKYHARVRKLYVGTKLDLYGSTSGRRPKLSEGEKTEV